MRKKNIFLKLTALSLSVALIFSGCSNSVFDRFNNKNPETENTTEEPVSDEEKAKVQAAFDKFLDEEYTESMSVSLVGTHFDLKEPENFGITEFDSIWGEMDEEDFEPSSKEDEELLNELKEFNYNALTDEQKLIYDTLEEYVKNCIPLDKYSYFGEVFSPSSGTQFELNLILSEYAIYDEEDIKDYLTVVESCDEYVISLLEYEKWRAKKGYALTDSAIDDVIEQCKDILSASEPAFVPVICDTIDKCDFIDNTAKQNYKNEIKRLATENFIPAYQAIVDELGKLKGSKTVDGGLCQYDNGKAYYEALVRLRTGSDMNMKELIKAIDKDIYDNLLMVSTLYSKDPDIYEKIDGDLPYTYTEPDEILANLTSMLKEDFPEAVCKDYDLNYVAKSMESSSNPAFYIIPPYDNYERNIIYINGSDEYSHMDLFPLLAHEGMPGHMYQNTFFLNTKPHPIRSLMHFGGYAEGWAQYVEHYSYDWSGLEKNIARFIKANDSFSFGLYSRVDIGINYEGWDLEETEKYLASYIADPSIAKELYDLFVNDPGTYLQYYVGHLEISALREEAEATLKEDFDVKEFHRFFLSVGPTYYDIIRDRMDSWMMEQ